MWGSLDPTMTESWPEDPAVKAWKDAEALAALQAQEAAKKRTWGETWQDVKGIPGRIGGFLSGSSTVPAAAPTSSGIWGGLNPMDEVASMPTGNPVSALGRGAGEAVVSGVTAPGDAMSGKLPMTGPDGNTSLEAVRRAFDTASLAGGGAVGGAASRAVPQLAADAAKSGAPIAAAGHMPGFYSALDEAVAGAKTNRAPGAQWEATLRNAGVKPEEMDYRGLTQMLQERRGQPITREELSAHLQANPVPEIRPVDYGAPPKWEDLPSKAKYEVQDMWRPQRGEYADPKEFYEQRIVPNANGGYQHITGKSTQYGDYQLPGAEDTYRERLLTLPAVESPTRFRVGEGGGMSRVDPNNYRGNHWDEPNVVAHRRSTDRDIDGVRSLHAEEIQSDWHQAGRKQGYATADVDAQRQLSRDLSDKINDAVGQAPSNLRTVERMQWAADNVPEFGNWVAQRNQINDVALKNVVPDAPFKKTWHELAAKDMLREAAEGDYPRISWTAGGSHPTNPKNLNTGGGAPNAERIAAYEAADRGMRGFYDKMIPEYLNKLGKKYGVKVERGSLPDRGGMSGEQAMDRMGIPKSEQRAFWEDLVSRPGAREEFFQQARDRGHDVFYMDIPEAMRNDIRSKGFSLFEDSSPGQAIATAGALNERAGAQAGLDVRGGLGGAAGGDAGVAAAQAAAARHAGAIKPLEGLPVKPLSVGGQPYVPGPIASVHDIAKSYMESTGRPYVRQDRYHPIDEAKSRAIAQAYEEMPHAPNDPKVKAAYKAMIDETIAQYDAAVKSGVKFEPIPPGMPDPYAETPRLAAKDVQENNHLWYFPTESGYGGDVGNPAAVQAIRDNPMLQKTGRKDVNGNDMVANDLFRVVHDFFGHLKEGYGFRAAGEDNAWRTHANMYSDAAKPAVTAETRGQNSWLNYGPHGEKNRTAKTEDTIFADQKIGVMPDWVWKDEMPPAAPAIAEGRSRFVDDSGMAIPGREYTKEAQRINKEIAAGPKGEGPLDLSMQGQVPGVEQRALDRYVPPRGISARMQDALENPAVREGVEESMRKGAGVEQWYHTEPVRQAFIDELGPDDGAAAFKRYMDQVAATSPRSDVPTNIRNASYYYAGGDPKKKNPYPYGHVAQNLHKQNVENIAEFGGWDVMQNPKPASFAENLRGNLEPVTVDTHAFRNIAMRTKDPRFLETSFTQKLDRESAGEGSLVSRFADVKTDNKGQRIATFRPQQLVKEGRLSIDDAQKQPSFWASKPKDNEYAAAEGLYREVGNRVGMRPADAQAAAWAGAGDMTGLGTVGTHTFNELMNERIMFTAKMRGESPQKVLRDFVTGRKPLLSDTSPGVAFGSLDGREER